ncbi:MAG: VIT and vWA domain-containing protein [Magnetospiraceae bacterium]
MNRTTLAALALAAILTSTSAAPATAAGLMKPANSGLPDLTLKDHAVSVVIEDGYAITTVEQVFANPHAQDLEAFYSFPVPEKGAVAAFTYWIDGKPVVGEVIAKDKAREIYETEKTAGRETALAEQDRYQNFDMRIWPVRAGSDVRTRLTYIQPAHLDTGFGRYLYGIEDGGVDVQRQAFWTANETVTGQFSFDLTLRSDYPVDAVQAPAHPDATITRTPEGYYTLHIGDQRMAAAGSDDTAEEGGVTPVAMTPQPGTPLTQDIVVNWRLADNLPGAIDLAAHRVTADGRGTFMMVVTPGADLQPITQGRDWVFVLDKSGSMSGKFATLSEGLSRTLRKLRPEDRFRLVVFDKNAWELTRGFQPATPGSIDQALRSLSGVQPDHGTNLYEGLQRGLKGLDSDRSTGIVLVTDGVANVGVTQTKDFVDLVTGTDARLFTVILGNSANRPLLEPMTRVSGGTAISVSNSDDMVGAVMSAVSKVGYEALHDVVVEIDGVKVSDLHPHQIGSLYRGEQLVMFGHYWQGGPAEVTVRAKISGAEKIYKTRFDFPQTASRNPEIERLWAYGAIEALMLEMDLYGGSPDREQAIEDIAVEYGLVTPYTSMIVVRDDVFQALGIDRQNRDRVATEAQAAQNRATAPVVSRRVDTAQPAFSAPRPTYRSGGGGGAGALSPATLALLLAAVAAILILRERRRT